MKPISRRAFLQTASTAIVAGTLLGKPASYFADTSAKLLLSERLRVWEYRRGGLGGPWEAWRKVNDDANVWTKVEVPHCFNAMDAVDPDVPYYQGPGWYRTRVFVNNPYPAGRTLLHFEGAGQKTDVFIHTDKVGSHVGGYDEFTIDITDQVNARPKIMGELDDAFLMLEAVMRGGFVAFVPMSVAREALRAGRVKVLATLSLRTAGVYAVYPADETLHLARTAVEKLIENARAELASS